MEYSKCPKCGGDRLKRVNDTLADFDCEDCGQRMDKRDYVQWALKNFSHKLDIYLIFDSMFEGVNDG